MENSKKKISKGDLAWNVLIPYLGMLFVRFLNSTEYLYQRSIQFEHMKFRFLNFITLLFVIVAAVAFAGCTSDASENAATTQTIPPSTPTNVPSTTIKTANPTPVPTPLPTAKPTPKPTTELATVCDCSGDIYNCGDFSSHKEAQNCFDYCQSIGKGDIHKLDTDKDKDACESL